MSPPSIRVSDQYGGGTGSRKTIAFIVDYVDFTPGGYESLFREVFDDRCRELDLNLLIISGSSLRARDIADHRAMHRCLDAGRIDGAILLSTHLVTTGGMESLLETCRRLAPSPLVSIGLALPDVPSLVIDNQAGVRAVVEHLVKHHRCRRIAFIGGIAKDPDAIARLDAYRDALAEHGIEFDPGLVVNGNFIWRDGYLVTKELLTRSVRPDAIVAANDSMAMGAMAAVEEAGLGVPSDILVTGFDDLVVARLRNPSLTTVRQPLELMAELAFEQLLRQLKGEAVELLTTVRTEFLPRASCGCGCEPSAEIQPARAHPGLTAIDFLRARRAHLVEDLAARLHSTGSRARANSIALLDALESELSGAAGAFAERIRTAVENAGGVVERYPELAAIISHLRIQLAPFSGPELESLWYTTQRLLTLASVQSSIAERHDFNQMGEGLVHVAGTMLTALDLDALREAVIGGLMWVGIRGALVSLYTDAGAGTMEPWLRFREGKPEPMDREAFHESRLYPDGGYPDDGRHTSMVFGLVLESRRLGVAAFEYRRDVFGYPVLRDQICAGLRTIELHGEVVLQARLRERSAQERAATARRMEALRVLAGGVAHDLNNSLGAIVALPDVILESLGRDESGGEDRFREIRADVESIKTAARRSARTIKDLLTLGRQGKITKEAVDLNSLLGAIMVSEVVRTARQQLPEVTLSFEPSSEPLSITGADTHVARAITNLVRNAMEATEGTGSVVIRTRGQIISRPQGNYESIPPGDYAVVTVSDTGRGIPEDDLARVFEPFFSKKRLSESSGSGLGLAIVHSVVKDHDGFVDLESVSGVGTTFSLYFPRSQRKAPSHPPESVHPRGGGRILVVDDDEIQRRTARRVLTQMGYEVATLESAEQAVAHFSGVGPDESGFDVVILDRHLNDEMDGLEVARRVRERHPRQAIVIASGQEATPEDATVSDVVWLLKPYSLGALARSVQRAAVTVEKK